MDNSPAHSCHSEVSLSQQSYHVSPEPTIHHQQLVHTSEDEDDEREASIGTQHDDDANLSEFVGGFEALPPKAILPPKPKEPTQKLLKGKVSVPKAGKTNRLQWTGKLEEANRRITNLENYINQLSQTMQTLYTSASTSIDHQYNQLKSKHRDLVTATALSTKQKLAASQHNLAKKSFEKSFASQKANLKSIRAKLAAANVKVAECKLKEATVNAERKLLKKQVQTGRSAGTSNKREDMVFRAELEVEKAAAKMDLKKESKKEEKGKQMKKKTKRFDKVRGFFQRGHFVSFVFNRFCSVHFMGLPLILTDIGLAL
jgi:hypothetical protein